MKKRTLLFAAVPVLIVLVVAVGLLLNRGKATSMHLVRTEGAVSVQDGEGQAMTIRDNLSLYDGHTVGTETQSYAWIDLDKVKLTKMDENSDVTVHKDGKRLELVVNAGSLFFNVTEPLQDDESMEIRGSNMFVGIRGTCGWVQLVQENCMRLYLLEGKVQCAVRDDAGNELVSQIVMPGQMAELVYDGENSSITVTEFSAIPDFVRTELDQMEQPEELANLLAELDNNPVDRAIEQYRAILAQAETYHYGDATPTGRYQYALVQLEADDPVPTLLLSQEEDNYSNRIRLFQYDPDTDQMIQPEEALEEYSGGGGYASGLSLQGDGTGLRLTEIAGGTGSTDITRITLQNGALTWEKQWSGRMDAVPPELSFADIPWHDLADTSALDSWTPESGTPQTDGPSAESGAENTLPTDGDRIVFTGTIGTYSYEQVIELQGCPDPNAPWTDPNQTFRLIVLDTPQEMELQPGDPVGSPRSDTVRLISVAYAEGLEQYEGQHLTFSIDPANTYWPSDTSMPVGQPSTRDVHVLQ